MPASACWTAAGIDPMPNSSVARSGTSRATWRPMACLDHRTGPARRQAFERRCSGNEQVDALVSDHSVAAGPGQVRVFLRDHLGPLCHIGGVMADDRAQAPPAGPVRGRHLDKQDIGAQIAHSGIVRWPDIHRPALEQVEIAEQRAIGGDGEAGGVDGPERVGQGDADEQLGLQALLLGDQACRQRGRLTRTFGPGDERAGGYDPSEVEPLQRADFHPSTAFKREEAEREALRIVAVLEPEDLGEVRFQHRLPGMLQFLLTPGDHGRRVAADGRCGPGTPHAAFGKDAHRMPCLRRQRY